MNIIRRIFIVTQFYRLVKLVLIRSSRTCYEWAYKRTFLCNKPSSSCSRSTLPNQVKISKNNNFVISKTWFTYTLEQRLTITCCQIHIGWILYASNLVCFYSLFSLTHWQHIFWMVFWKNVGKSSTQEHNIRETCRKYQFTKVILIGHRPDDTETGDNSA